MTKQPHHKYGFLSSLFEEISLLNDEDNQSKGSQEYNVRHFLKFGLMAIAAIIGLSLNFGCATTPKIVTEYKYINVPIKCEIPLPIRPIYIDNAIEMTIITMRYVEELEVALKACK